MKPVVTRAGFVAAAMAAAAAAGIWIGQVVPVGAQEKKSVWDGVYSEEQASRGKDEYEYNCGNCHIHDLSGDSIKDVEDRYDGSGYGQFKSDVGAAVVEVLTPVQARYRELRSDPAELSRLLDRGADKAREASAPTLEEMYRRMGFVRA